MTSAILGALLGSLIGGHLAPTRESDYRRIQADPMRALAEMVAAADDAGEMESYADAQIRYRIQGAVIGAALAGVVGAIVAALARGAPPARLTSRSSPDSAHESARPS